MSLRLRATAFVNASSRVGSTDSVHRSLIEVHDQHRALIVQLEPGMRSDARDIDRNDN